MIIGHIGARGGSKGLPGKNLKLICGKPLIQWSIDQLMDHNMVDAFTVSTDCPEIYALALEQGAIDIGLRPESLASDTCSKWSVWQHSLQSLTDKSFDITTFLDLDCTNPLRDLSDITGALNLYQNSEVDLVMSCCPARKNPYFNLLEFNSRGYLEVSKPLSSNVVARQSAPIVLEHIASTYVVSPNYLRTNSFLYGGKVLPYYMDPSKSYDIDSPLDYKIVEYLLSSVL